MHFPSVWKALEAMKRQDGLGASPTGQRLPKRTYGGWGSQKPFLTGRLVKLNWKIPLHFQAISKARKSLKWKNGLGASPTLES